MSMFDPQAFMDTTTDQSNDTTMTPCPEGEWQATASDVNIKTGTSQKTGEDWARLDVKWEIVGTEANTISERDKIIVTQGVMLDVNGSGLDMGKGKNIGLGRLREALGLNTPGAPFSPRMIIGRSAKVAIKHREYEGKIFDDVKAALPL